MSLLWRHHKPKTKTKRAEPKGVEPSITFPKHVGGGWYELPNGERVQGKEEAERLLKEAGD